MRTISLTCAAAVALSSWACGATTGTTATAGQPPATLTTATVTFMTRDDGKDEDSALAVQLLDDAARLTADATVAEVEFDENSVSSPLTLNVTRPMAGGDVDDARLRLRLTPDGRDVWVFDLRLALQLSDGSERQYFWSGIRLDESTPERTVTLQSGRMP
jgi:hypothetical protein